MAEDTDRLFVVTGGPGSGKSSLIDALEARGFARSVEAGRGIIRDQVAIGGSALPWQDRDAFAELMLSWDMRSHHAARAVGAVVFLDRGVPDVAGYLRVIGRPVPEHVVRAAETFRYNRRVFIAPAWPEIFRRDAERRQDVDEARRTHDAMAETYRGFGYDLVALPKVCVEERVRFVLERVGLADVDGDTRLAAGAEQARPTAG